MLADHLAELARLKEARKLEARKRRRRGRLIRAELARWCRRQRRAGLVPCSMRGLAARLGITPRNVFSTLARTGTLGRYAELVAEHTGLQLDLLRPHEVAPGHQINAAAMTALKKARATAPLVLGNRRPSFYRQVV